MTEHELQLLVCGEADVDLATLRKHTSYGEGIGPNHRHVRFLWQVLEAFTPEQRRLFLKFIWGRNRLPLTEDDWVRLPASGNSMKIHPYHTSSPDAHLPVTHTCFFSMEWPSYSSRQIAHSKLLYAILNCQAIDGDNTNEGRANAAALA